MRGYREKLFRFVRWFDGSLGDLNLPTVRAFVAELQDTKKFAEHPSTPPQELCLSSQTIKHFVMVLRGFATRLFEEGYTKENLIERLKAPKVPKKVMQVLTDEEIERLLSCCDTAIFTGARNAAIILLFLDTGLRCSELLGLRIGDLHIEDRWLKIMGKGQKERIVPFGNRASRVLYRYLNYRGKDNGNDRVFLSVEGKPLTESGLQTLFQRLRKQVQMPRLHVHLLRHTFATRFLMAGNDSLKLQRLLGHETLEMTRRYVDMVAAMGAVTNRVVSPMDLASLNRVERQKMGVNRASRVASSGGNSARRKRPS
ncbi:MAG: tyrosine-type recombinase/integrase [Chloroflexi bacterium]|nr:tyrosine-type recombinase/integrase [Chloroflexota bacterium]